MLRRAARRRWEKQPGRSPPEYVPNDHAENAQEEERPKPIEAGQVS
jgi:hypothetical protein